MNRILVVMVCFVLCSVAALTDDVAHAGDSALSGTVQYLEFEKGYYALPEPGSAIFINWEPLGKELPTSRNERVYGHLTFTYGGTRVHIPAGIRWQGDSSASNPQKNFNFFFYNSVTEDGHQGGEAWVKIGRSPEARKLMFKSEFTESSKSHNFISYALWDQITQSRATFPQYEVDNAWVGEQKIPDGVGTGARGFPYVWPAVLYVNGEFYGIGNLMSVKDWYNYNLPEDDPDGDGILWRINSGAGGRWDEVAFGSAKFEPLVPKEKNWGAKQQDAVARLLAFINSDKDNFKENLDDYFDRQNIIDYTLFLDFTVDYDGRHEVMLLTYDAEKWFILPWDKDTTFGADWRGGPARDLGSSGFIQTADADDGDAMPFTKTLYGFKPELDARYAQLRDLGIFSKQNILNLFKSYSEMIPRHLWEMDRAKWYGVTGSVQRRDSFDYLGAGQLMEFVEKRIARMDRFYNYER